MAGQYFRQAREDKGITIRRMARTIRKTPEYVVAVEGGFVTPPPHITMAWSRATSTPPAALLKKATPTPKAKATPTPKAKAKATPTPTPATLAEVLRDIRRRSSFPAISDFARHAGVAYGTVQRAEDPDRRTHNTTIRAYADLPEAAPHRAYLLEVAGPVPVYRATLALAEVLRGIREAQVPTMSGRAASRVFGVSNGMVSQWERAKTTPPREHLKTYASLPNHPYTYEDLLALGNLPLEAPPTIRASVLECIRAGRPLSTLPKRQTLPAETYKLLAAGRIKAVGLRSFVLPTPEHHALEDALRAIGHPCPSILPPDDMVAQHPRLKPLRDAVLPRRVPEPAAARAHRTLSLRLRKARAASALNQKALAAKLRVRNTAVSKWETGRRLPPPETMVQLCAELSLPPAEMLQLLRDATPKHNAYVRAVQHLLSTQEPTPARDLANLLGVTAKHAMLIWRQLEHEGCVYKNANGAYKWRTHPDQGKIT